MPLEPFPDGQEWLSGGVEKEIGEKWASAYTHTHTHTHKHSLSFPDLSMFEWSQQPQSRRENSEFLQKVVLQRT